MGMLNGYVYLSPLGQAVTLVRCFALVAVGNVEAVICSKPFSWRMTIHLPIVRVVGGKQNTMESVTMVSRSSATKVGMQEGA